MGKIIKNGIDYGGGVAIDSALDATSMNAIANKPVAEAITQLNNDLKDIGEYSATEHAIGTYVNKILYRKIIDIGQLPSSASNKDINLGITSPFTVRHLYGYASTGTTQIPLPFPNTATSTVSVMVTSGVLRIEVFSDRSSFTEGQVIIEYTKD